MPSFGNAFDGKASDRKLTNEELIRAIRFMIAAEYEAVQLYMQLAESTDNEMARKVLIDISNEELVHAGEFTKLLFILNPGEETFYKKGMNEVEELISGSEIKESVGNYEECFNNTLFEWKIPNTNNLSKMEKKRFFDQVNKKLRRQENNGKSKSNIFSAATQS
jgi:rubrerythrin